MKYLLVLPVILIHLLFYSCAKEEDWSSSIPYASVTIDIQTQLESDFNIPLHYKIYSGQGYSGVIVITNETASGLYAYDLCCPYDLGKVQMSESSLISIECQKCKSRYDLLNNGKVLSGPSGEKLKQYRNIYKNGYFYRIRN